jgi:hypothetical protein
LRKLDWWVNVNKHTIASNAKHGRNEPPVRFCRGKSGKQTYCHELELPEGSVVVYNANEPILKCGARLAIKCPSEPKVIK